MKILTNLSVFCVGFLRSLKREREIFLNWEKKTMIKFQNNIRRKSNMGCLSSLQIKSSTNFENYNFYLISILSYFCCNFSLMSIGAVSSFRQTIYNQFLKMLKYGQVVCHRWCLALLNAIWVFRHTPLTSFSTYQREYSTYSGTYQFE